MNTLLIDLGLRWLHILSAVALGGGILFWRVALIAPLETMPAEPRQALAAPLRSRWAKVVMSASGLLLLTGLVNFMVIVQRYDLDRTVFPGNKYHMMFGIKFLLALAVFLLSALLAGRTSLAQKLQRNSRFWLNVNVGLVVVVICLGGVMKAAPRHAKSVESSQNERGLDGRVTIVPTSLIGSTVSE